MLSYLLHRLAHSVFVLFLVTIVAFLLVLLSGDPVAIMLPIHATEQDRLTLQREMGLDEENAYLTLQRQSRQRRMTMKEM